VLVPVVAGLCHRSPFVGIVCGSFALGILVFWAMLTGSAPLSLR
jgi:hypothetical protein